MNKRNVNKRTFRKIILKCHWAQRKVIMHLLNYAGKQIFLISYEAVLPWANAHWLKGKGLFIAVFVIVNLHLILLAEPFLQKSAVYLKISSWKCRYSQTQKNKAVPSEVFLPGTVKAAFICAAKQTVSWGEKGRRSTGMCFNCDINKTATEFLRKQVLFVDESADGNDLDNGNGPWLGLQPACSYQHYL